MNETQKQLKEILDCYDKDGAMSAHQAIDAFRTLLPQTKTVHGVEIDMHLTEAEDGQDVYFLDPAYRKGVSQLMFRAGLFSDELMLKNGIIYDTAEKAKAHRDVLFPNGVWDE